MPSDMHRDLVREIATSIPPVFVTVGADVWSLHVFGVTRIGRDSFVQIALIGPRTGTITVRTPGVVPRGVMARQILDAVHDWLLAGNEPDHDHAYLELAGIVDWPC
jgi:hypothetical protein